MTLAEISGLAGNGLMLLFIAGIPAYASYRKVPVYDTFIEGAKEGFPVFLRVMPHMIAMLVAIGMLRASGAFDLLNVWLGPLLSTLGIPPDLVPAALIRPFSSSAATAAVADILKTQGGNSPLSHLAVIVAGATETTFYIIAIYFGAANIRDHRHAVLASVMVDLVGILSAVWIGQRLLQ